MNKKAIAILGAIFILIVGTLGFLIYSKYSGGQPEENDIVADSQGQDQAVNPDGGNNQDVVDNNSASDFQNRLHKLTDRTVISPSLFFNGRGITYLSDSGSLYQADLLESGGVLELANERDLGVPYKEGITKIIWPKQGNQFMAEAWSFNQRIWSLYNGDLGVYADLPTQVASVDWMPSGDKIVYIWQEDGKATLNISDPDTTNWQEIAEMWEFNDSVRVSPDGQYILYFMEDTQESVNPINVTNLEGSLWESLVKDGFNYGVLWSPDGQRFLFGKQTPGTNELALWVYDIASGKAQTLGINSTVEKAAWDKDGKTVYVSGSMGGGFGSLNSEKIYKINAVNPTQAEEYDSENLSIEASDLFLSSAGDRLFFKNNIDGNLYYLDLVR